MHKSHLLTATACAATLFALVGTASAAESQGTIRDFGDQTCKEVMRLSGSDRDISLAFAHGYMLGKKGTTQYEVEALAQVTDQFIDYCLDHPTENALQSFEKFAK